MAAQTVLKGAVMAGSMALTVARVVGGWALMAVQALWNAARMAAAWVIAMGPVGWIIAGVVALAPRQPRRVEQQQQIDVGRIIELAAAQLAHRDHRDPVGLGAGDALVDRGRERAVDRLVGEIGQMPGDVFELIPGPSAERAAARRQHEASDFAAPAAAVRADVVVADVVVVGRGENGAEDVLAGRCTIRRKECAEVRGQCVPEAGGSLGSGLRASHGRKVRDIKIQRATPEIIGIGLGIRISRRIDHHGNLPCSDLITDMRAAVLNFVDDLGGDAALREKSRGAPCCDNPKSAVLQSLRNGRGDFFVFVTHADKHPPFTRQPHTAA